MKTNCIVFYMVAGSIIMISATTQKTTSHTEQSAIISALSAPKIEALPPNKWITLNMDEQKISKNLQMAGQPDPKGFKVTQNGAAQLMIFRPEYIKDNRTAHIIIGTHGTYAPKAPGFSDPDNVYFQGIRNFAEQTALHKKVPVLIVSYVWDAGNWTSSRIKAGKDLAELINKYFSSSKKPVILVSHSHGCNVANIATHYVRLPVELLVHYASPIREKDAQTDCTTQLCRDQLYVPTKFKRLLSFYSLHDFVQVAGGITTQAWKMLESFASTITGASDVRLYKQAAETGNVYNISTKVNGQYPSHSAIVIASWFLPAILSRLDMYTYNHDLIVNVDTEGKEGTITLAINKPLAKSEITEKNKEVVEDETAFSDIEAAKFKDLYNQNITDETNLAKKVWDMTANMVKLLDEKSLKATIPATK